MDYHTYDFIIKNDKQLQHLKEMGVTADLVIGTWYIIGSVNKEETLVWANEIKSLE